MSIKNKLISILEHNKGNYVSGNFLANELGVSRNTVWKIIKQLENEGIEITAKTNKGYMLLQECDYISEEVIRKHLNLNSKRKMEILKTIHSTNDHAKKLAQNSKNEISVVIADKQEAGKGRLGRVFVSPPHSGIYLSLIIRPEFNIETSQFLTSCIAVAVSEAIDNICGCETKIKWVNDIYLNSKKICGILTEASISFESNSLEYVIIGIGVNVGSIKKSLSSELLEIASSIEDELGKNFSRSIIIAEILNRVDFHLANIKSLNFMKRYKHRSFIIGKEILVSTNKLQKKAIALDINDKAGLVVKYEDGKIETLNTGEASIIKK